ncbi:MAG TPA: redoxin domain-containing protein [Chitinophaga sp.]|uniref:TlpA family protein disulfide reductase n=1 Tax=Chitinophaga sp. TaxID=1869181 RepID=UPI002DB6960F|nr:redoxin domain-containing protein [Chitinophaga sp.]HEU4552225.1 redoxin domain-containing protein [Chitinophaga sp.]
MKLLCTLILVVMLAGCVSHNERVITGYEGKPLPDFTVLKMDSITRITTASIPTGKPMVIFLFSPYCPYCRAQTADIIKNEKELKNVQVYMLSEFPFVTLKGYYEQYELNKYPNITLVQDYDAYFAKFYKASAVPFIAVYNKDKTLKQVLLGNVGVNKIKDAVFE